mmetsp:Transcript_9437/g.38226  ORF Transcript_9437/g.38226 Transcript_9437/m.38226 type:complete len:588 (+) Transcript_9437:57-1820(+)
MTAGEERPVVVKTRWVSAEEDEPGAPPRGNATAEVRPSGGYFEAEVSLPGVTSAESIVAEIVTAAAAGARPSLCVRAKADGGGGGGASLSADVPLPDGCDHGEIGRVRWSRKRSTLRVRFAASSPAAARGAEGDGDDEDGGGPLAEYLRMLGVRDGEAGGSEPELEEDGDPRDDGMLDSGDEKRENPLRDGKTPRRPTTKTPPGQAVRASGNKKKRRKAKAKGVAGAVVVATPGRRLETVRPGLTLSDLSDDLATQLDARGFAHAQFITRDAVCVVRDEIKRVAPLYTDGEIWLGKNDAGAQIAVKSVRGDRVFWMDQATLDGPGARFDAMRSMLVAIDELVLDHLARACPRRLGGLADRTHAMLAEYPGCGARFVRHVDNTGRDGRRLTVLCYLNPDYAGEHGGALKVYEAADADGTRGVEVAPAAGTIAMFYADETPHEVLPSARSRHSFTVWYYDDEEWRDSETRRGEAAAADSRAAHMPSVDGGARVVDDPGATLAALDKSDREAQAFVRTVMTQRLTPGEAADLARGLGERALRTVATVFGAPDPASLVVALTQMSQSDLDELRMEMTSMGMDNAPDAELAA